jgi:Flp pilus assembly protein TadG
MKLVASRRRKCSQSGIGALEVAISAGLMIIIVALALDVTLLNYSFTVNDAACRDAARAMAAQGSVTSGGNPLGAAKAACRMHQTDGYFISQPQLRTAALNTNGDTVYPVYSYSSYWNPPVGTTPTVTCTTYVDCRLPVPLLFWGNDASSYFSSNGDKIRFVRRYIFPIVHLSTM